MRLRTAHKEIEHKDGHIWNLEGRLKEAEERTENEAQKAKITELKTADAVHPSKDSLTQRLLDRAIADRDTAAIFAYKAVKPRAYDKGFFEGRKVSIEKTIKKLADDVCCYKNCGFKHGWLKVL
ncbi:hypothetical protein CsSME_00046226 [Camellia sinensis var. sinensis]